MRPASTFSIGYMFGPLSRSSSSALFSQGLFQSEVGDAFDFQKCPTGVCGSLVAVVAVRELVSLKLFETSCPEVVALSDCINCFALVIRGRMAGKHAAMIEQQDSTVLHMLTPIPSQLRSVIDQFVWAIWSMRTMEAAQTLCINGLATVTEISPNTYKIPSTKMPLNHALVFLERLRLRMIGIGNAMNTMSSRRLLMPVPKAIFSMFRHFAFGMLWFHDACTGVH